MIGLASRIELLPAVGIAVLLAIYCMVELARIWWETRPQRQAEARQRRGDRVRTERAARRGMTS
jgi:hypothetical protein